MLTDPAMERHAAPGHPERHERLAAVAAGVERGADAAGARFIARSPTPADDPAITAVHDADYLASLDDLVLMAYKQYAAAANWPAHNY